MRTLYGLLTGDAQKELYRTDRMVEALNRLYSFEQLDTLQAEILEAH